MGTQTNAIPQPLVRANQWFIVSFVLLSWVTTWHLLIIIPLLTGVWSLIFGWNPVMRLIKPLLRKPLATYLPHDRGEQRFNQKIAVFCLAIGLLGFILKLPVLFYIFTIMVALAAFIAILGFCVGCFIRFQWQQYRYRHSSR